METLNIKWTDELKIKFADFCLEMLPYTPMFMLVNDFIKKEKIDAKKD